MSSLAIKMPWSATWNQIDAWAAIADCPWRAFNTHFALRQPLGNRLEKRTSWTSCNKLFRFLYLAPSAIGNDFPVATILVQQAELLGLEWIIFAGWESVASDAGMHAARSEPRVLPPALPRRPIIGACISFVYHTVVLWFVFLALLLATPSKPVGYVSSLFFFPFCRCAWNGKRCWRSRRSEPARRRFREWSPASRAYSKEDRGNGTEWSASLRHQQTAPCFSWLRQ